MALTLKKQKEAFNFYESFSDMLFNTLVLFLVLIVGLITLASNEASKFRAKSKDLEAKEQALAKRIEKMQGEETALKYERDRVQEEGQKIARQNAILSQKQKDLELAIAQRTQDIQQVATDANNRAQALRNSVAAFLGFEGERKNVVLILDLSASMIETPKLEERFKRVQQQIGNLIDHLDFETFNVIGFGGKGPSGDEPRIILASDRMLDNSPASRARIKQTFLSWMPDGKTPTLAALDTAFKQSNVDTIILFTDGMPTIPQMSNQKFLETVRSMNRNKVVINTVGIGAYADENLRDFLTALAESSGGRFQGQ